MINGYQIIIAAIWDFPLNICRRKRFSNCRLYTLTDINAPLAIHLHFMFLLWCTKMTSIPGIMVRWLQYHNNVQGNLLINLY